MQAINHQGTNICIKTRSTRLEPFSGRLGHSNFHYHPQVMSGPSVECREVRNYLQPQRLHNKVHIHIGELTDNRLVTFENPPETVVGTQHTLQAWISRITPNHLTK
jgi:hypothetical protein